MSRYVADINDCAISGERIFLFVPHIYHIHFEISHASFFLHGLQADARRDATTPLRT